MSNGLSTAQTEPRVALSPKAFLRDLRSTFPGIVARLLPEETEEFPGPKVCVYNVVRFPDGLPIYVPERSEGGYEPGYTCGTHDAFTAWAWDRGWTAVDYDGLHLIMPVAKFLRTAMERSANDEAIRRWCDEHLAEGSPLLPLMSAQVESGSEATSFHRGLH